jgi:small conductance mechanosensitive channel
MSFEWLDGAIKATASWGMAALGGIALIVAGFVVARLVRETVRHALKRTRLDEQLVGLIATIAYYFTMAVVLIAAFGVMGIETASLITILGTCSLAIGLALQGSLSNFAAGIMLFVFRPFREGDFIETGDYKGHVAALRLFSTELDTLQNVRVVVPNTYISQRPLENWSTNGACRLDLMIEVAIGGDLAKIKPSIARALQQDARVLPDPPPSVGVENFGDSSAQLVIRPWCRAEDYWALKVELPETIKAAVEAAGSTMPTPQREVFVTQTAAA